MERETLGTKRQLPWPFGGCATEREYEGLKKYEWLSLSEDMVIQEGHVRVDLESLNKQYF